MKIKNELIFVISVILMIVGKIIASLAAPLFEQINYGQLVECLVNVLNCVIWIVSILCLMLFVRKKTGISILSNPKTRKQQLDNKNLIALFVIVSISILVISAQIGFQVKPFYDLGMKFTGNELLEHVSVWLLSSVKCVWMVILMKASQAYGERFSKNKYIPWGGIGLLLTVGILDLVFVPTTLKFTYFLLNIVFGYGYKLTNQSVAKTYICILLIYIL